MNFKISAAAEFIKKLNKLDQKTFDSIYERLINDIETNKNDSSKKQGQDNDWKKVNNDMWRMFK